MFSKEWPYAGGYSGRSSTSLLRYSWEWGILEGSPGVGVPEGVWHQLYRYLADRTFLRADGSKLTIAVKCVDSGGHHTQEVYRFCRRYARQGFVATKGYNVTGKPLITRSQGDKGQRIF